MRFILIDHPVLESFLHSVGWRSALNKLLGNNGCHSCPRKLLSGRRRSLRISWSNLKQMKNIYSLIPDKVLFCLNFCLVGYCLMLFNWADHGFQRFWALNLFRPWIHDKELTSRLHMIKTPNMYSLKCNKESISRASNMAFLKKK